MFKLLKIVVLLAVLGCAAAAAYTYLWASRDKGAKQREEIGEPAVRVEEKYGFTAEP